MKERSLPPSGTSRSAKACQRDLIAGVNTVETLPMFEAMNHVPVGIDLMHMRKTLYMSAISNPLNSLVLEL